MKKIATAEEITAEMQERINRVMQRRGVLAPIPIRTSGALEKANWTTDGMPSVPLLCVASFIQIVDRTAEETISRRQRSPHPIGRADRQRPLRPERFCSNLPWIDEDGEGVPAAVFLTAIFGFFFSRLLRI